MKFYSTPKYGWYSYQWAKHRNNGKAYYYYDYDTNENIIATHLTEKMELPDFWLKIFPDFMYVGRVSNIIGVCTDPPELSPLIDYKVSTISGKPTMIKVEEFFDEELFKID